MWNGEILDGIRKRTRNVNQSTYMVGTKKTSEQGGLVTEKDAGYAFHGPWRLEQSNSNPLLWFTA